MVPASGSDFNECFLALNPKPQTLRAVKAHRSYALVKVAPNPVLFSPKVLGSRV